MLKLLCLIPFFSPALSPAFSPALSPTTPDHNPDTLSTKQIKLEEITVTGFKQRDNRLEALSVSNLNSRFLKNHEIVSVKDLSALLPNFYMPDYGSKQNSPIYIRGIGSKINAPSVGFYVDGVPHFEKSAFDIDLSDISNIEVLRGPQGTLYGRNAIGGIINIYTHSPLDYQNTRLKVGYGSRNDISVQLSDYRKLSDKFGLAVSGRYHHHDGFFNNLFLDEKADRMNEGVGRLGLVWKPSERWTWKWNTSFNYSTQGGYPYGVYDKETGATSSVNYNRYSSYRRGLFTTGLNAQYQGKGFSLNSQTSFQQLTDRQGIDQDFTTKDLYYVILRMNQRMYSQELTFKSTTESRYQWVTGVFGFRQETNNRLETQYISKAYSTPKFYDIPITGLALYHQSSYNFWKGLTASIGLRYDYEHAKDHYEAYQKPLQTEGNGELKSSFDSRLSFKQFTPKFTLQYLFPEKHLIYGSVARGYKAGGFNTSFQKEDERTFKPEYNWNYELGTKLSLLNERLTVDLCLFYIDWRDQQIAQIVPGVGNIQRNAGHSVSKGMEFSMMARPNKNLRLSLNYGYTHATFLDYKKNDEVDYSGNVLPMVPRHTLSANVDYSFYDLFHTIDRLTISSNLTGTGSIYWNEDNKAKQTFYALLNMKMTADIGRISLELWSKNLTNTDYLSYYFVTSSAYAQKGKPFAIGTSVIYNF